MERRLLILISTIYILNWNAFDMHAIRDIASQKVIADIIFITPEDDDEFIYYPFGKFKSISKFIESFEKYENKTIKKDIGDWQCAKLQTVNSQTRIGLLQTTEMSEIGSVHDGYVQIFNSIINGDLCLNRGIHVGMSKDEFIDSMQYNMDRNVLQSFDRICIEPMLFGTWIMFTFDNNVLISIKISTDYIGNIQYF